jgi:signal transduction histidine kinase
MLRSLRVRLFVAMVAVSCVALAAAWFLFARTARLEFQRFEVEGEATNLDRLGAALADHYGRTATWDGVAPLLEQLGSVSGRRLLLVTPDGAPIAVWPPALARTQIAIGPNHTVTLRIEEGGIVEEAVMVNAPHADVRAPDGAPAGTLYSAPMGGPAGDAFAASLGRSLAPLAAAIFATVLFATFLLSRRVLGPVETLTEAVRRMERGELSQRVEARTDDEIGELANAFNSMAETIARAERLRKDLVNDVAHELRTPLTNIRCQVEAMQDGLVAADREALASLHEEVMHLNRVIDDLRDLSLADAGRLALDRQPVGVAEAVQSAVAALRPRAAANDLTLAIDVAADLPLVEADPVRLGQVLRNLLDNAVAHTPPGGTVTVSADARGGLVELLVRDSGTGIDAEHLPFVFERFYRTDPSRARATGGAGLGLAIVKQLVESHGGHVRAESEPGKGSTFVVSWPVAG